MGICVHVSIRGSKVKVGWRHLGQREGEKERVKETERTGGGAGVREITTTEGRSVERTRKEDSRSRSEGYGRTEKGYLQGDNVI